MSIEMMNRLNGVACTCGKVHRFSAEVLTGKGVIAQLPACIQKCGGTRPFLLSDKNTYSAGGAPVCAVLNSAGIEYSSYCFPDAAPEPDEKSVGSAAMHFDSRCDIIVGIGSGVINDIGKLLSSLTGLPYIIVATAPSMDGYASATSSMTRSGLKISLPTRGAEVIIGDTQVLCQAPLHMLKAGLGDMLAKYVSICEWRLSHIITGEYYCEEIASLIRSALQRCVSNAQGLLDRDEAAVEAVFEGLVIGGVAMNYAGLSRPASGVEHYISHVLDMRAAAFGTPADLHGIQCAVGTLIAVKLYEQLAALAPDREHALRNAAQFDYDQWAKQLRTLLGKGADSMIELERHEQKYSPTLHAKRLEIIIAHWNDILQIIRQELPSSAALEALLDTLGAPKTLSDIGTDSSMLTDIFHATRDIRDKYVLSRLAWDLGVMEQL